MGLMKKIYDPVHRFIHIDEWENALISSRPFQRLHYIHQLGVTFFLSILEGPTEDLNTL